MSEANSTTQSGVRQIPLTQGKVALIDDEDFERVNQYKWHALRDSHGTTWYARHVTPNPTRVLLLMHRLIVNAPFGMEVDHVNGDGLDNRRANLRICTHSENVCNQRKTHGTSRYKGVSWHKDTGKWQAQIKVNGRGMYLGCFTTEEEAHAAYCSASAKYHGGFGRTA